MTTLDKMLALNSAFAEAHTDSNLWVSDIQNGHIIARGANQAFEIEFSETANTFSFAAQDDWTPIKISYAQEMLSGHFQDFMIISEFKGSYPDVKIFPDVDVQELTNGESNPVFVTLPIGLANVTSGNRRHYDEKFLREMEKQVREKKPIGLMGHLSKDERATAFPAEAVHWIGVERIGELLWGKGYVPAGEPRNRLQRYKATGKKIATSIDAQGEGVWDNSLEAYRMIAETLELSQIDIAPADRAGIPNLAAVPLLTTEMWNGTTGSSKIFVNGNSGKEDEEMEREAVIKTITPAEVALLPDSVIAEIAKQVSSQIAESVGLPKETDVVSTLQEMRLAEETARQERVSARITEMAEDEETGVKVPAVQELIIELVQARHPATVEDAERIYAEVANSPRIVETLEKFVQSKMGPKVETPTQPKTAEKKSSKFFVYPGKE